MVPPRFGPPGGFRPAAPPDMRRPNIRSRAVCRFCVHCCHPININWVTCRYEYCRQPVAQLVPMPETPEGWSICRGCQHVFIRDGQRFCGLCQWSTPAGTAYRKALTQSIRDLMNQQEQIRNLFVPVAHLAQPGAAAPVPGPAPPVPVQPDIAAPKVPVPLVNPVAAAEFLENPDDLEDLRLEEMMLQE